MIERTKQLVEDKYCIANGYKHDAKVKFGVLLNVMIVRMYRMTSKELIKSLMIKQ